MADSKIRKHDDSGLQPVPDERKAQLSGLSDDRKARLRELLDHLNRTPLVFEDESVAPEVDCDVLSSLVRGELPEDQARLIYRLVYSFKSWCDAHSEILIKEARKRPK